jgi:multidrug efflux pump subunit AcrA (membrane-fusion protein)
MMKMIRPERTRNTVHLVVTSLFTIFAVGGCVMQSTYDAALQEGMTTRAELSRAKDEQKVLARQVSDMELLNADAVREAEAAASALLQAKDDAEQRRQQAEQQIAKLQQKAAQATKQQRALRYELTVAKENAMALQELIDVYQKKIRDGAVVAASSPVPEPAVHKPFDPSTIPVPQDLPAVPAVSPPKPTPPAPAPTPSTNPPKSPQPPADEGWVSSIKSWLLSLWHSVFS